MTHSDMIKLVKRITENNNYIFPHQRDLYYCRRRKIFLHKPSAGKKNLHALTISNGESKVAHLGIECELVGRYDMDVNPDWIIEDMLNVS